MTGVDPFLNSWNILFFDFIRAGVLHCQLYLVKRKEKGK
jgi:hypothetical protein